MTAQLLASELNNLIQESKRKNNDLRQAAEKSLEDLKSIRGGSEAQVAAELAQKVNFINPFVIACGAKNAKFTGIAIVCLLRLIVVSALPRSKLNAILEALREATSAGVDAQLKILQALPTLLQNYTADIKGDLLLTALNICFILQSSKNAIINNTSAATLQQLVVSVFDKVAAEDKSPSESSFIGDAPTQDGAVNLRVAGLDAYRVFNDICLMTENERPEFLRFSGLPQTFGLELIESVLTSHATIFSTHPEQSHIVRTRVIPFIVETLSGKPKFATSVRLIRILYTLLKRHLGILSSRGAEAFDILTQLLDQDTAIWKRALCMEVFRGIFSEPALIRRIFSLYDASEGQKNVLQNITATFVRVSTEKPAVIGLGHQSTIPAANYSTGSSTDQAMLESSGVTGVTGIISGAVGESQNIGISSVWSMIRVPCIDQLDKTDAPPIPDSYVYALTLSCMTSLSEGLAKFILPLTVPGENRSRKRGGKMSDSGRSSPAPVDSDSAKFSIERGTLDRSNSNSFKRNPVPVNPLSLTDHPLQADVKLCADIIEDCWPAILATCSTFIYAAIDSELYHGLVRAFQKFAHVAGLLQLVTPRDAFLTTLGKAAVPPNVFTASMNTGSSKAATLTPTAETPNTIFGNTRGLLSVDSLVTPTGEKQRQGSFDSNMASQSLNTRNLLCLRALLNLGIALGPTLSSSWRIVLETLQQADYVLFSAGKYPGKIPVSVSKNPDPRAENEASSLLSNFGGEIRAVETAASRLFESTVDFPNESFVEVVGAVCNLLGAKIDVPSSQPTSRPHSPAKATPPSTATRTPSGQHRRTFSTSAPPSSGPQQEDHFALAKIGDIAMINLDRLLNYPPNESGWELLVGELIATLSSPSISATTRSRAAEIVVRLVLDSAKAVTTRDEEPRGIVQLRLMEALRDSVAQLQKNDRQLSVSDHATDVDIHKIVLEGLKNLLEDCGETLASGWDIAFEVINSIFIQGRNFGDGPRGSDGQPLKLPTKSHKLIRSSFNSLQLICSDFLSSLPNSCFLILVDTLYKFSSQTDDLNIALTTVTFFWVLSDFLSGKSQSLIITDELVGDSDSVLVDKASEPNTSTSNSALWMLLLLRLTNVASDDRVDLRNSAIQTLLRIFDAYGEKLDPEAWSVCIKSVVFRLFSSIETELRDVEEEADVPLLQWHDTAVVVLNGVSGLLSNYLDVFTAHPTFNERWQQLLGHFATLLDANVLDISTATFKALSQILSQSDSGAKENFNKETLDLAWKLWSRGIPVAVDSDADAKENQNCLLAYVGALRDVYRLIESDVTVEKVDRMLTLLNEAMEVAIPGAYVTDIDYVTQLQGQILDVIKLIRTDIPGVPPALINQTAQFVSLAFTERSSWRVDTASKKRTYVAMSKASMEILQSLVTTHAGDAEIYTSGSFMASLTALSRPIALKYQFPIATKATQPWRQATTSSLAILKATLPQLHNHEIPRTKIQGIWQEVVTIANSINHADCDEYADEATIREDQEFDISSFLELLELMIPALGAGVILDATRKLFAESLFRISVIHAPAPLESSALFDSAASSEALGLTNLYESRRGRTMDPTPSSRVKMAYTCLDVLFSLVASHDEAETPSIAVLPPTPGFPPPSNFPSSTSSSSLPSEAPHALHIRLARIAAPYLTLRAALTLRAYTADQPLRGHMPQPRSQRTELVRILEQLVTLKSEGEAVPDVANVDSESRKHLLRLYPLLVNAAQVAGSTGDAMVLELVGRGLKVVGDEFGI